MTYHKKIVLVILYYLAAILLIRRIHTWSPTNMAGPGLDLVICFLTLTISIALFAGSLTKVQAANRRSYIYCCINVLGTAGIILLLYHEWTAPR